MIATFYMGTGRRKTSVARVRLLPGSGQVIINNISADSYLQHNPNNMAIALKPLKILGLENDYDIKVNAHGGGLSGQADAIRLGVARALCTVNPDYRSLLKSNRLLTRDARSVERKKYGLRKARKAPQFSKR
uniref:ribosomal protein S9 n=1 Tax=Timspurckia oligopyrenoides TaxID=708627 RepID=UPI001FCDC922|nr:ribosomal protein S9 [Timspurckia oligopyrenoides]UNJ17502.1 ribosomal protein S9 [Timspurckia oligopyrenoides]